VAFDATHTTSPAGAILASIDGGRHFLSTQGHRLLARLAVDVEAVRAQLRQAVPNLVVPGPADFGAGGFDPLKLVVGLARTGADGVDVESELRERGITFEMADLDTVVATVALTDTPETLQTLTIALIGALTAGAGPARPMQRRISFAVEPRQVCTPRAAFFAPDEAVPSAAAAGRTSAELVAVYPPGIPVLSPGEMVTKELVDALHAQMAAGSRVAYADDPTLATIRVLQ
jgi:lysine decarboxylase